jgi:spore coat protein U-like protein
MGEKEGGIMRRISQIAVCMAVLLAALADPAGPAQGQTSQATLTIRGTVTAECSIGISNNSATVNLTAGQSAVTVATVEERCNAANGYVVTVASQNGGTLSSGTSSVAYGLQYGDVAAQNGSVATSRAATGQARTTTVAVSIPASPELPADDYADTVVISITAK